MSEHKPSKTLLNKYGFFWVTMSLFLVSFVAHWYFAWGAFVQEQLQHNQTPQTSAFLTIVMRDTFENWQSEFLQLVWQVAGLALLFHIGSPQSKEGNDRLEEKVDLILLAVDKNASKDIKRLDDIYMRD